MTNENDTNDKLVLIVEDELIVTELLQKYLSELEELKGVKLLFANNVDQCLKILETIKPSLMILDLSLNGDAEHTGLRIFNQYKGQFKIAVFSAYDDYMVKCLNEGATEYILKPTNRKEYRRLILKYV